MVNTLSPEAPASVPTTATPELPAECAQDTRRKAFVAVSQKAFFTNGYGGTTMSAIAAQVGGSKTTLWTYFPSKQDLFTAVVDDVVEEYGCALSIQLPLDQPVVEVLELFGAAMLSTMLSPPIINLHRVVAGEAARFPELGRLFYERGAKRGKARLAAYMNAVMEDGRLRRGDPQLAARQFSAMCQANSFQLALYAIETPAPDDVARDITTAVDCFLRAWEADPEATLASTNR
jgi:TetR/AcrR family transcriptional repressor of mexJK operon